MSALRFFAALAITLLSTTASAQTTDEATLVVRDGADLVAVVYDGHDARVLRAGVTVARFEAESVLQALWAVDEPCHDAVQAARLYPRALSDAELAAVADLEWTERDGVMVCDGADLDHCETRAPVLGG